MNQLYHILIIIRNIKKVTSKRFFCCNDEEDHMIPVEIGRAGEWADPS